ncbi:MAG: putative transposase [Nostocoides sp.]
MVPRADAILIGPAAALVEDETGGRVFLHGELSMAWEPGDDACRRLAAVQLVRIKAAKVVQIAAGFGVDPDTLRRWGKALAGRGAAALVPAKAGPKGPSRLTAAVVADIRSRRAAGASLRAIAAAVAVSTDSVRRALPLPPDGARPATGTVSNDAPASSDGPATKSPTVAAGGQDDPVPVLPDPADRSGERGAARWGQLSAAPPVFAPAGRVPLAGLLLAIPALEATGLLPCATTVFGSLPNGFYGLDTMLIEAVLRALAGEPRAEGATRVDPVALGRVLGLDRAPEVKTIRRKIAVLAATSRAGELQGAIAARHVARLDASNPDLAAVFYVDGHVRAYQGGRSLAKTHIARLRFPAPATVETWVSDAAGAPFLVVMTQPGASLAMELRRLLPELRKAVGDQRRVLVGFDRGGWSPALFAHMHSEGFDVLTWRKVPAADVAPELFTDVTHIDDHGRAHQWRVADTTVDLPTSEHGDTFTMRQVSLEVANTKHGKETHGQDSTRQIHILTTRTDLSPGQIIYRMGSRWRQENYFRYARMHFDLDSHDAYATTDDDPTRMVPNPAKKQAHQRVLAARAGYERALARTDAALLDATHPGAPGETVLITNQDHDAITADLRAAEASLDSAQTTHRSTPTRLPLAQINPGQQVLDTETKLITHAIRMSAFNIMNDLARAVRVYTGYARADDEAHTLARQALTGSGDIDPRDGFLTVRLDPLPTRRATTAVAELCEHLTATKTRYPGTNLVLRYEVKKRP